MVGLTCRRASQLAHAIPYFTRGHEPPVSIFVASSEKFPQENTHIIPLPSPPNLAPTRPHLLVLLLALLLFLKFRIFLIQWAKSKRNPATRPLAQIPLANPLAAPNKLQSPAHRCKSPRKPNRSAPPVLFQLSRNSHPRSRRNVRLASPLFAVSSARAKLVA